MQREFAGRGIAWREPDGRNLIWSRRPVAGAAGRGESLRCDAAGNNFVDRWIENSLGSDEERTLVLFFHARDLLVMHAVRGDHN